MSRSTEFWYLASPYSKYPEGTEKAFQVISREAGALISEGLNIYCPISHSHPICEHGGVDLADYDIWLPLDKAMFQHAKGIIVCTMESWEKSYGVNWEIGEFIAAGKPVIYMVPGHADTVAYEIQQLQYQEAVGGA